MTDLGGFADEISPERLRGGKDAEEKMVSSEMSAWAQIGHSLKTDSSAR